MNRISVGQITFRVVAGRSLGPVCVQDGPDAYPSGGPCREDDRPPACVLERGRATYPRLCPRPRPMAVASRRVLLPAYTVMRLSDMRSCRRPRTCTWVATTSNRPLMGVRRLGRAGLPGYRVSVSSRPLADVRDRVTPRCVWSPVPTAAGRGRGRAFDLRPGRGVVVAIGWGRWVCRARPIGVRWGGR